MGITSTKYITREQALSRIKDILHNYETMNKEWLELMTYEGDFKLSEIRDFVDLSLKDNLDNMFDDELEDLMDKPFIRYSMFDNYIITKSGERE